MSELDVRAEVAREHGLDLRAATFLTGTSLEELEASASRLAQLIAKHDHSEPDPSQPNFLADLRAGREQRRREILDVVTGRVQPRDQATGQFAPRAGSFDGGARQAAVRLPPSPEQAQAQHNQWLGRVLASRAGDLGARF